MVTAIDVVVLWVLRFQSSLVGQNGKVGPSQLAAQLRCYLYEIRENRQYTLHRHWNVLSSVTLVRCRFLWIALLPSFYTQSLQAELSDPNSRFDPRRRPSRGSVIGQLSTVVPVRFLGVQMSFWIPPEGDDIVQIYECLLRFYCSHYIVHRTLEDACCVFQT